jgi:hypothetical protein
MRNVVELVAAAGLAVLLGCSSGKPAPVPFTIELRALSDDGAPLAGVAFSLGKKTAGLTGTEGRVVQKVAGDEGSTLRVGVTCPVDYDPPGQLPVVRLTRTRTIDAREAQPLPVEVRCERRQSDIVVVVRADRGSRLPVLIDGKLVTTTDDDGLAHVLVRRARTEKKLDVALDTTGRASLKPVNPARTYDISGRDAVILFEQTFVATPPAVARAVAPRRHIPVRVD